MPRAEIRRLALAVLLLLPIAGPRAEPRSTRPVDGGGRAGPPPETQTEPPGAANPRLDPLARSRGMRISFGSYTSVQVNVDALGQNIVGDAANEPSIAVNPTDPSNMVIGWRQFDTIQSSFRQGGWSFTTDAGASWTFPGVLTPGVFRSDPVLDADSDGNFYYQSLTNSFLMDVFKSTDGGASWGPPVPSFGGDKNWMVIDRSGGSGDGQIYGIWQRFAGCCGFDVFTRSSNAGASFESPVQVALSPTFGTLAVGPGGEVYACGIDGSVTQDFSTVVVARSSDAQNSTQSPTFAGSVVDLEGSLGFTAGPNPSGLLGQVNVWVDPSDGATSGNVYVVASVSPDSGSDPLDVHLSRSVDGGQSWSRPVRINDDDSDDNWQWFAAHSVAANGRIDVIWNDTREFGQVNLSQLYYAYSWDAGVSWSPNVAVSPAFDSFLGWPQQQKIGDYYTIRSDTTGADVAYAATFNGEQDVYYVRLFPDCNGNAISDVTDVASGGSSDCNGNEIPDECEVADCLGSGAVPDGKFVSGAPLTLEPAENDQVRLSWGASCATGDSDFEIYEGSIGNFDSYDPRVCTTDGLTTQTLVPIDGDTFYLVVPANSSREGSYGRNSAGDERLPAAAACYPQALVGCFEIP